jgi:hopene-associated glycosyltransferase HpnB
VPSPALLLATITLVIWLYLALARGTFWLLHPFDDDLAEHAPPLKWPTIVAVVPARNEATTIGATVGALAQQHYPGEFSILVVDDHSDDATPALALQVAKEHNTASGVQFRSASALPAGWTGKLWALHEGVNAAAPSAPAYYWFSDADIVHAQDTLRRLVARAEQHQLDLTSLMVLLQAKTLPERATIPAFLYFFLKLYPPTWTANPRARTAGAAGGCVLLRCEALERVGGFAAIRADVIDDCALARAVKRSGGRIWMGLTRTSVSLRSYGSFAEIRDLIARTAFTQVRYSVVLLLGTLAGMFLTYLAPVLLLLVPNSSVRLLGLAAWLLMALTFLPTVRFYRLSPLWAPLLPLTAAFYSYATLLSGIRFWLHRGAQWKGRTQAPGSARNLL